MIFLKGPVFSRRVHITEKFAKIIKLGFHSFRFWILNFEQTQGDSIFGRSSNGGPIFGVSVERPSHMALMLGGANGNLTELAFCGFLCKKNPCVF